MSIFPFIETTEVKAESLPLYKDALMGSDGLPVFKDGEIQFTTGVEAIKTWCRYALLTQRKRYLPLPWSYGSDTEKLIGKCFLPEVTEAELKRYIKECLLQNPYIKSITDIKVSFDEYKLTGSFTISTIYGDGEMNV